MRPPAGMNGLAPQRGHGSLSGAKGLRSIHTKVHNTAGKSRRSVNPGLDLDNPSQYEEDHVPGIGAGLKDEYGTFS